MNHDEVNFDSNLIQQHKDELIQSEDSELGPEYVKDNIEMNFVPTAEQKNDTDTVCKETSILENSAYKAQSNINIVQEPTKNNTFIVILLISVFILLVGLCIYIALSISNEGLGAQKKDTVYQTDEENPWGEILGEDAEKQKNDSEQQSSDNDKEEKNQTIYDSIDWNDDSWQDKYVNHYASEFTGPYYDETVDCMDENVDYKIKRKFSHKYDKEHNICIRSSYIQLEGDIPNLSSINKKLKESALQYEEMYNSNKTGVYEIVDPDAGGMITETSCYVTFNDQDKISIAINENTKLNYDSITNLKGINIDLLTGTILDNSQILDLDDTFGEEFRNRSNKQNGVCEYAIEPYSNIEILQMLKDDGSLILFYTPLGIELGYQYQGNAYSGWVTITMQDYEDYLYKM